MNDNSTIKCFVGDLPDKDEISIITNGKITAAECSSSCDETSPCLSTITGTWATGPAKGTPFSMTECLPAMPADPSPEQRKSFWQQVGQTIGLGPLLQGWIGKQAELAAAAAEAQAEAETAAADAGDGEDVGVLDDLGDLMEGIALI